MVFYRFTCVGASVVEWMIIILACAIVIGPVLWLQPSQREKRIAALRQDAAKAGLKVRLQRYQDYPIAVYYLPLDLPEDPETLTLLQQSYEHEAHFFKSWDVTVGQILLPANQQQVLKLFLQELSPEIVGLEVKVDALGVWWREQSLAIVDIQNILAAMKRLLIEKT